MIRPLIRHTVLCLTVSTILFSSCQQEELFQAQFPQEEALAPADSEQFREGTYIVILKQNAAPEDVYNPGAKVEQADRFLQIQQRLLHSVALKGSDIEQIFDGAVTGFTARLTPSQVHKLKADPLVAHIEQDKLISIGAVRSVLGKTAVKLNPGLTFSKSAGTTNETIREPLSPAPPYKALSPLSGETIPWNIAKVGYGDGTGKTAWVVDSGIDIQHPDLNVDMRRSMSFIYGDPSFVDGYGHGTVVAGIIGAKNNGTGMIGVAANASIVALRVFDNEGKGTVSRAIGAITHVINNGAPGDVVNLSIGSGLSSILDNTVIKAAEKGILFAIAAGNSGIDCSNSSPARVIAPGVYTVSGMDSYHRLGQNSNFGPPVRFAAPGINVISTKLGGGLTQGSSGTSFAAPHVAGILLLRGQVLSQGTITGDKDDTPDPIASLN